MSSSHKIFRKFGDTKYFKIKLKNILQNSSCWWQPSQKLLKFFPIFNNCYLWKEIRNILINSKQKIHEITLQNFQASQWNRNILMEIVVFRKFAILKVFYTWYRLNGFMSSQLIYRKYLVEGSSMKLFSESYCWFLLAFQYIHIIGRFPCI